MLFEAGRGRASWRTRSVFRIVRRLQAPICAVLICLGLFGLWRSRRHAANALKVNEWANVPPGSVARAVVMAKRKREDVTWTTELAPQWIPYVYSVQKESGYPLRPPINKGSEAMVYLTFIIDNYDSLPNITAFIHASSTSWHNDVVGERTSEVMENLRHDTIEEQGYANLRCTHFPNCPTSINPFNPTKKDIRRKGARFYFVQYYMDIFNVPREKVPTQIGAVCCAQFAASRDQIRQRPKADYVRMRDWIIDIDLNTIDVGWVFELIWHIIFGREPIFCPEYKTCRCDLYGWCGPLPPKVENAPAQIGNETMLQDQE